jgi:HK97 family phage major capsid protein
MEQELIENKLELRKLSEDIISGKINSTEGNKKLEELRAKKTEIEKRIALKNTPTAIVNADAKNAFTEIRTAMVEKRAITLNGTGAITQVQQLVKELQKKTPLLERVRYFYGANSQTNIPLFSPTIASPAPYAEGSKSIEEDTQASLGNKSLTPHAFISLLAVSGEALKLGSVNFEAELPSIFADAFGQEFHKEILTGTGSDRQFKGIFTTVAAGSPIEVSRPNIQSLRDLALTLQDYNDSGVIIMHPGVYSVIMADSTGGEVDLYKEELIRSKTIEGISVILAGSASNSLVSGSVFAVGGRLQNYGLAMASEIQIEPLRKVGDTNTYFQATLYANGNSIQDKEWLGLAVE